MRVKSVYLAEIQEAGVSQETQPLTEAPTKGQVVASASPNWNDPNVPTGDAPPLPSWPLLFSVLAWVGWLVFLLVMMVMRLKS